jgi:hypothetical protein
VFVLCDTGRKRYQMLKMTKKKRFRLPVNSSTLYERMGTGTRYERRPIQPLVEIVLGRNEEPCDALRRSTMIGHQ